MHPTWVNARVEFSHEFGRLHNGAEKTPWKSVKSLARISAPWDRAGARGVCEIGPNGQVHRHYQITHNALQSTQIDIYDINTLGICNQRNFRAKIRHFTQVGFAEIPAKIRACDQFTGTAMRLHNSAGKPVPFTNGARSPWNTPGNWWFLLSDASRTLADVNYSIFFHDELIQLWFVLTCAPCRSPQYFPVSRIRVVIGPVSWGRSYRLWNLQQQYTTCALELPSWRNKRWDALLLHLHAYMPNKTTQTPK